jgi:dTDP-4-amino-4,6-dideoxygalactose transaminase
MTEPIPLVDLAAQYREVSDQVLPAIETILATGSFIGGSSVAEFEAAYANLVGARHCIGVGNGTDALEIAFRAVGVARGDEVVLPANTFLATAEAVARVGASVVLVDADAETLLLRTDEVPSVLTERTRAIVPVHLYGQVAPVERLREIPLPAGAAVVEDAAQSQGARRFGVVAGALGDVAATSFYPGKNLGAAGDAGAVTTNDDDIARVCRMLGAHGSETKYVHEILGFNSRLDAIQAVVLSAKLERLGTWNAARRVAADRYEKLLAGMPDVRLPRTLEGNEHVWHLYTIRVPERDKVLAMLNEQGIGAGIHYPTPVHLSPAFADLGYARGDFPVSEAAADSLLSLPIYGHITAELQERVVDALRVALDRI